jgi:heme-degrading monooxygenase HmoA
MTGFELSQINVARFLLPNEHPDNADFMAALDHVNAQAEAAPGFVWRLKGEGNNATDIAAVAEDPRLIVNMSVWRDLDALAAFVYRQTDHRTVMRQRRRWFEPLPVHQALWWVPAGHRPTVEEGLARLAHLAQHGPDAQAFTFLSPFAAPDGTPATPILDECA